MEKRSHATTHGYQSFADQYAQLGFTGTYYLAFRDIPTLLAEHGVRPGVALDHGCGAGRSTRFLQSLGLETIGVDRTESMLNQARAVDPAGDYRLLSNTQLSCISEASIELVFQSSVMEEIGDLATIEAVLREFHRVLHPDGRVVIVTVSDIAPMGDWASLSYPDRAKRPQSGDTVRCLVRNTDIAFHDYYWTDENYYGLFRSAGFELLTHHRPIADASEEFEWRDEVNRSPWSVFVLAKARC